MKIFNLKIAIVLSSIFYFSCNNSTDSVESTNQESNYTDTIPTIKFDIDYNEIDERDIIREVGSIVNSKLNDKKKFELLLSKLEKVSFIDNSEFQFITDPIDKSSAKDIYDNSKRTYWVTRTPPVYFDLKPLYDALTANSISLDKAGMFIYSGKYLSNGKRTVLLELTKNNGSSVISPTNLPEAINEYFNYGEVCPTVCPINGIYQ